VPPNSINQSKGISPNGRSFRAKHAIITAPHFPVFRIIARSFGNSCSAWDTPWEELEEEGDITRSPDHSSPRIKLAWRCGTERDEDHKNVATRLSDRGYRRTLDCGAVDRRVTAFAVWEECLNLIAGLWLIAWPWLFGFQDSDAMTIDVVIGTAVAALAAFEAWIAYASASEGVSSFSGKPV